MPKHGNHNLRLETTGTILFTPLYNFSQNELEVFQKYIVDNLAKIFIQPSTSLAEVSILFTKKKDGSLHLYVDYKSLNFITKKNHYHLPLISKVFDQVIKAKIFIKLDIYTAYNRI